MGTGRAAGRVEHWGERRVAWVVGRDLGPALALCASGAADTLGFSKAKGFDGSALPSAEVLTRHASGIVATYVEGVDVSSLAECTALRYLALHGYSGSIDLSALRSLQELRLDGRRGMHFPPPDTPLLRLHVQGYASPRRNLQDLPGWATLETLEIVRGQIVSLEGIGRFSRLRRLSLSYLPRLTDIAEAGGLPLETLEFDRCKEAIDLDAIGKLGGLVDLKITHCGTIPSVATIGRLPALERFSFVGTVVTDGDLSPLLGLPYVGFMDKRHYSHKYKDFEARRLRRTE